MSPSHEFAESISAHSPFAILW